MYGVEAVGRVVEHQEHDTNVVRAGCSAQEQQVTILVICYLLEAPVLLRHLSGDFQGAHVLVVERQVDAIAVLVDMMHQTPTVILVGAIRPTLVGLAKVIVKPVPEIHDGYKFCQGMAC